MKGGAGNSEGRAALNECQTHNTVEGAENHQKKKSLHKEGKKHHRLAREAEERGHTKHPKKEETFV